MIKTFLTLTKSIMHHKIKIKISLIFLLLTTVIYSQEDTKPQLPNINPPSPESFMFAQYGKNGINEYSGKLSASIPLYEYTAGMLKMPITLNYSGAGVKVEDISTWVGMNWNLSVGGVITREIRDGLDEVNFNRNFIDEDNLKNNANDLCQPNSQFYWSMARNDVAYNTEVDIFNFNFMGYSGSFYLDVNFNPVYIENENELKIEITGGNSAANLVNNKAFTITTPDGIKYYFGGNETESTMVVSGAHSINSDGVTSFFLYKIVHPVNGTILLEYDNMVPKAQHLSKSYDMNTHYYSNNFGTTLLYVTPFVERKFTTKILSPKRLKKIKSLDNDFEVSFVRTDYNNYNFTSVLNSIIVTRTNFSNRLVKKINFKHEAKTAPDKETDFLKASRFFLMELEINKELDPVGDKHEKYVFEYDDPFGLPDRMSNARDAVGYFNGKNLNTSLIPLPSSLYTFNQPENFANLTPSFSHAKKGSLTKIIYPTKGYSKFEYEPIQARKESDITYGLQISSYIQNIFEYPYEMTIPGYNNLSEGYIDFPTITTNQTIQFKLNLKVTEHSNTSTMAGKGVEFIITDVTTGQVTNFTKVYPLIGYPDFYEYTFAVGHNYTFKLRFKDNYTTSSDYQAIQCTVDFTVAGNNTVVEGAGVRLKRDINYNEAGVQTDSKRYYYGTIDGGYNNVSTFPDFEYYPSVSLVKGGAEPVGVGGTSFTVSASFSSEIATRTGKRKESPEKFPVVSISYGGDNFENGGIEKTFLNVEDGFSFTKKIININDGCFRDGGLIYCGPPPEAGVPQSANIIRKNFKTNEKTNHLVFNGKLVSERTYVNKNNSLFKIKEQTTNYNLNEKLDKKVTNFVGRVMIDDMSNTHSCSPNMTPPFYSSLAACYFGYYYTNVYNFNLKNTTTVDYIDPVPLSSYVKVYDNYSSLLISPDLLSEGLSEETRADQSAVESSFKKIITTQDYEYGTLRGLPNKVTASTSEGTPRIIRNLYANQYGSLTGLTNSQSAAYQKMISQNIIASPIQVKQYEGSAGLLSTQLTTFQDTNGHVVQELIKTAKGDQVLEDRIVFEEYDAKGKPTLVSYKDGSKIKYLYNANNQVIAKFENFSGSLDPNTTAITSDSCTFINSYTESLVTVYNYDPFTNLLVKITSPNCRNSYYEYDAFNRLKFIKDHDLNVVKSFCYNYKGQVTDCSNQSSTAAKLTYSNTAKSGSFTRNNCGAGGTSTAVIYTVEAGKYISYDSQAEADNMAQADVNANGQAYANESNTAECIYGSTAKSASFTRNNCAVGGTPETIVYTVPAGTYTSTESQVAADALADQDINVNGQNYVNSNAKCTFSNSSRSGSFTRNNCGSGGTGGEKTYTVPAGQYTSTESQAAADAMADQDVNNNGQAYANANGSCTFYSTAQSGWFTKNNCSSGGYGSNVYYTQNASIVSSQISQADADASGYSKFISDGQAYANANGYCTYYSSAQSASFTKNDCAAGGIGSSVSYSQGYGAVASNISQADADALGLSKFNSDGQVYANANGYCTYYSSARNASFTKNNCAAGGTGSAVSYSQAYGVVTSTISQADAETLGLNKFNADGQAYANTNGYCTYYSVAQSGSFVKNNCPTGGSGSSVYYSQNAGASVSNNSQVEADALGIAKFNSDGQAYANANGSCTFYSVAQSGWFTKNNCSAGGSGSSLYYTQNAGIVSSQVSQADADGLGLSKFNADGQAYANANGYCTYYSSARNASFTKNNCDAGGAGSAVAYSQAYGDVTSTISQADAETLGLNKFNADGQAYANANGYCTYYSTVLSGMFTKNNCSAGGVGSDFLYTQPAGAVTSNISQADADARALDKFNIDGQAAINAGGSCRYSSAAMSGNFTKNNCGSGFTGSVVSYSQPLGASTSIVSQAEADYQGMVKLNLDGQAYANANGTCQGVTFDYTYGVTSPEDVSVTVTSSSPNHNGATFNLRIRYYNFSFALRTLDRTIVLPAGQTSLTAGYRTTGMEEFLDVQLLSLIKN
ncbi:hypothetical protein DM790_01975 [Flavobacterium collinsii]|nr:hypothetical protein [Flavobacterium collinsii]